MRGMRGMVGARGEDNIEKQNLAKSTSIGFDGRGFRKRS